MATRPYIDPLAPEKANPFNHTAGMTVEVLPTVTRDKISAAGSGCYTALARNLGMTKFRGSFDWPDRLTTDIGKGTDFIIAHRGHAFAIYRQADGTALDILGV